MISVSTKSYRTILVAKPQNTNYVHDPNWLAEASRKLLPQLLLQGILVAALDKRIEATIRRFLYQQTSVQTTKIKDITQNRAPTNNGI